MRIVLFLLFTLYFVSLKPLIAVIELQPHRAYYTVTLEGRPTPQSSVVDVQGTMLIEFSKVNEGWTVQERSDIRLIHDDGSTERNRWGYVTFESQDGSRLHFNTYRKIEGDLVEEIKGQAVRKDKKINVTYQKPQKKTLTITEDVLFPTQHIKSLLEVAQKGESIFPRLVFDGSSEVGPSEINTFIGSKKVVPENPSADIEHQFANQPFWPVRFAVHSQGKIDYEPIYVTTQDLLPNGIIKQYVIDYGGIKIRGVLDRIEFLQEGS